IGIGYQSITTPFAITSLVQILLLAGRIDEAASRMKSFEDNALDPVPLLSFYIAFGKLQLIITQNDYAGVLNFAPALLNQLRTMGVRQFIPEVSCILARAQRALGQVEEAGESLKQAQVAAEALGARWDLWQILGALAEIETERGNAHAADDYRDQARNIIAHIAERVPLPALRDSFLALAQVRNIIGGG